MKQGKLYTKLILWVFLAAVVCYFGYYVFSAIYAPLTTVTAIEYEAGSGSYTTGYVVREESLVLSHYDITTLVVSEGERVSAGQALATGYADDAAQDRQAQIQELEHQLEQLEYAHTFSADAADQAKLDSEIQSHLEHMSRYVARRDMNSAQDSSASLKGLILRRTSSEADNETMAQRIETLQGQLEALYNEAAADTRTVAAGGSGFFSGSVDGYETVLTPASLDDLTVARLERMGPQDPSATAVGKLITSSTWYYVTAVDSELVQDVRVGASVPVTFANLSRDDLVMTVERVGEDENGKRLLVLSCDRYMQDLTLLREQSADVVFTSYTGLRVPKEAIRVTEDQRTGIYILEGSSAVWKYVTILHDSSESYVVALDKSSTDNLWPGDEVIVGTMELYDGKVVR